MIWRKARVCELSGLLQTLTFEPAQEPVANVINAKCIFSWKDDEQEWVVKANSRLAVRGFSQRDIIDF